MNKFFAMYHKLREYYHSPAFANRCQQIVRFFVVAQQRGMDRVHSIDFLAPLLLRLYLVPVFWMAGTQKLLNFARTAEWFGNADWGLGLPMPGVLVILVMLTEIFGAIFLLLGFAVRWSAVPLLITMAVAALTVHWKNGWLAIASASGPFTTERTAAAVERLQKAKELLQQAGDYTDLTRYGDLVMLNNGIEFAATYFVMLLALLIMGGGRYVSVDYWLRKHYM